MTSIDCPLAALPVKSHASHTGGFTGTVPAGTVVTYNCDPNYQIAPVASLTVAETSRSVTCNGANGIFEDLFFKCVREYNLDI